MVSGPDTGANLQQAETLVAEAVKVGAKLLVLPENFALMGNETDKLKVKEIDGEGPIQAFLANLAKKYAVWVVGGTIPIIGDNQGKVRAACLVFNDKGERVVRYDKIHLFDVDVPGTTESYRESDSIEPGSEIKVIDTPFGRLGISVCYDLRFPEFFRNMVKDGMEILVIPSAFTEKTGAAHWELLLRARAVENQCYVIASNQGGLHLNGRKTFGHSMIIDPWGVIMQCHKTGNGFVIADIDREILEKVRTSFPALEHRRIFNETLCD
jgi:nitrilase